MAGTVLWNHRLTWYLHDSDGLKRTWNLGSCTRELRGDSVAVFALFRWFRTDSPGEIMENMADSSLICHLKHVETCGSSECAMVTEHKPERTPRSHATTIVALEMEKRHFFRMFFVCFDQWCAEITSDSSGSQTKRKVYQLGSCKLFTTRKAVLWSIPGPWCPGTNMWCNYQQLWCRSNGFLEFFGVEYGGVTSWCWEKRLHSFQTKKCSVGLDVLSSKTCMTEGSARREVQDLHQKMHRENWPHAQLKPYPSRRSSLAFPVHVQCESVKHTDPHHPRFPITVETNMSLHIHLGIIHPYNSSSRNHQYRLIQGKSTRT